jgi:hypothetical protein
MGMRCCYVLALCLLAVAAARAETLSGAWCGIAEQTNPEGDKSYWSAAMILRGTEGTMEYPSLDCGGTLTYERSDGGVHFYREHITWGRDRCLDGGLVAVEPVGTSVRWEWTGSGVKATAELTPTCPEKPGSAGLHEEHPRRAGARVASSRTAC